jgi:hypothetical protein
MPVARLVSRMFVSATVLVMVRPMLVMMMTPMMAVVSVTVRRCVIQVNMRLMIAFVAMPNRDSAAWRIGRVNEQTVALTRRQKHLGPEGDVSSQRSLSSQRPTGEFLYITIFRTRLDFKTIVPSDHSIFTRCNP